MDKNRLLSKINMLHTRNITTETDNLLLFKGLFYKNLYCNHLKSICHHVRFPTSCTSNTELLGQWAKTIMENSVLRKQECLFELIFFVIEKKSVMSVCFLGC